MKVSSQLWRAVRRTPTMFVITLAVVTPFLLGGGGLPKMDLNLDYEPVPAGSYHIQAQNGPIKYSDVKHYIPTLRLSPAAPSRLVMTFELKEDRRARRDPVFGTFTLVFEKGMTSPSEIRTPNNLPDVRNPPGAPDVTMGSFWIGCTKAGKIKSNSAKDNDGRGRLYVQHSFGYVEGYRLMGTRSDNHTVECR